MMKKTYVLDEVVGDGVVEDEGGEKEKKGGKPLRVIFTLC
jgi:hypothetical protein